MKGVENVRLLKSGLLVTTWIFVGIFTAIIGATIIDLTEIADCDYEVIGQVLIGLNLAVPIGSVAAGIVCSRYPRGLDIVICLFLLTLSLSSAALPWCPMLGLMAAVMMVQGVSRGVVTCCGNVMIIQIWKEKSSAPLHAMHFGTGFGSFIAPLMAGPFLSPHPSRANTTPTETTAIPHQGNNLTSLNITIDRIANLTLSQTRIYIPYGIMAGFGILCAAAFFVFYIIAMGQQVHKKDNKQENGEQEISYKEKKSPKMKISRFLGSCANGESVFGLQMAVFIFFFYACVSGLALSYPTYILPVVVGSRLHLSKQQGTYLNSAYWGCFAAGRLFSAVVAKWIRPRVMFMTELTATLATSCLLAFHGPTGRAFLWAYTCTFAFSSAPLFPSGIAWSEHYLDINGPLMSMLQSGFGFGSFLASWFGGYGLKHFGSNFPLFLNFSFGLGAVAVYAVMQLTASVHGSKVKVVNYVEMRDTRKSESSDVGMDSYM